MKNSSLLLEYGIGRFGFNPLLVLGKRSFLETDPCHVVQRIFAKFGRKAEPVHIGLEPSPAMIDGIVAKLRCEGISVTDSMRQLPGIRILSSKSSTASLPNLILPS